MLKFSMKSTSLSLPLVVQQLNNWKIYTTMPAAIPKYTYKLNLPLGYVHKFFRQMYYSLSPLCSINVNYIRYHTIPQSLDQPPPPPCVTKSMKDPLPKLANKSFA